MKLIHYLCFASILAFQRPSPTSLLLDLTLIRSKLDTSDQGFSCTSFSRIITGGLSQLQLDARSKRTVKNKNPFKRDEFQRFIPWIFIKNTLEMSNQKKTLKPMCWKVKHDKEGRWERKCWTNHWQVFAPKCCNLCLRISWSNWF